MSAEQNKATIRRWVEVGWNKGDLSIVEEIYAPNYAYHDPSAPNVPPTSDSIRMVVSLYRGAMPDFKMTIEDMVAEDDKVVWRWSAAGTHEGSLMNIPPSGHKLRVSGIVISRFVDGRWAEDYVNWDTLGLFQQIGVIPALA